MCFARRNAVISPNLIYKHRGLYVHTHSNNGQGKCSIISRYPFSGITPNKYGVYIDLGEGIVVVGDELSRCCLSPYGPYQLNGIEYKDFPATDDVDYVVKVNKEARQGMVDKLLEDFHSSTTPFCLSFGDFNEPSWLDWTEGALSAGLAPLRCPVAYHPFPVGRRYKR